MNDRSHASILLSVLLAWAAPALAQVPLGAEFRVDERGLAVARGDSTGSAAVRPDGSFVVAWVADDGTGDLDVRARLFNPRGQPGGPEFTVNTYTTGRQYEQSIGIDYFLNFVVVWAGQANGVYGQRFDPNGGRLGVEFRINPVTSGGSEPSIAVMRSGEFVVVWTGQDGNQTGVFGQRFDAAGLPVGAEFRVNTTTAGAQNRATVAFDSFRDFVVVWESGPNPSPGPLTSAFGQRFSASGAPQGAEFRISSDPASFQFRTRAARADDGSFIVVWGMGGVSARRFDRFGAPLGPDFRVEQNTAFPGSSPDPKADPDGDFTIAWYDAGQDGSGAGVFARRFESSGTAGNQFRVNTYTTGAQSHPSLGSDPAGNFVVAWYSSQNGVDGVFAQRFAGGLSPAALAVDTSAGPSSNGNGVFEPGETVGIAPSWLNASFSAQTVSGQATLFGGPGNAPGDPAYTITDDTGTYGTVPSNGTASCASAGDCYATRITVPSARPLPHWDAYVLEELSPPTLAAAKYWTLHVGDSFGDVPRSSAFYRFVETLFHHGVTAGCGAMQYCPGAGTTREQMAVFVLVAKEGNGYAPPACGVPVFNDVPAASPFCPWIEELARRGVVGGCGGGRYCPADAASREQMAVFVLRAKEPALVPPPCGAPLFNDVPASSPFCPWIEELARRGVVSGCGGGRYCPAATVSREQMAVFLSVTFGLALYGP